MHDIFDSLIDISDVSKKSNVEIEQYFVTRSYMALSLLQEMRISPTDAANSITDGGADDGIDLIYVDKKNARIYFGQSKWRVRINKGVEEIDFTKFRDGVKNVLDLKWTKNNKNLHRFKEAIELQLRNIDTDVVMILAHTSELDIAANIKLKIDDFVTQENKYTEEFVSFKEFRLHQAAKIARSYIRPENISVPVMLGHWGMRSEPYKAVYGSVSAVDVVGWYEEHGNKLFAENLRYAIEKSDVNDGIIGTAANDPLNFWYFNNGITAICDSVDKAPMGGTNTSSGVFEVKK